MRARRFSITACLILLSAGPALAASAVPSTSGGQVSVAQVLAMLDKAPGNATARQVLTAYLAGIGETVGLLTDSPEPAARARCSKPLGIDDRQARLALAEASGGAEPPGETPATPLIVRDMLRRAGCRIGR